MSNMIKDTIRRYAAMALSLTVVICFCFIGTPGNIFTTAADSSKELSNAVDPDMIYPELDDLIRYPHDPGYVKSAVYGFRYRAADPATATAITRRFLLTVCFCSSVI